MDKPYSPPVGTAVRPTGVRPGQASAPAQARSPYQQRVDQIKMRIVDLSHRNMENAMRVLRQWLADKGEGSR